MNKQPMNEQIDYEAENEFECLLQALNNFSCAKQRQQEAYNLYRGVSLRYHLSSFNNSVKDAAAEFGNYLGKVIDRRVERKISTLRNVESIA